MVTERAFRAQETKAVTLKTVGPLALGKRLHLIVTVRANGTTLRRTYPVIFTLERLDAAHDVETRQSPDA